MLNLNSQTEKPDFRLCRNNDKEKINYFFGKRAILLSGLLFICFILSPRYSPLFASQEEKLIQNTLEQVEKICKRTKNIESLGKETLSQSAVLLDLSESSLPALIKIVRNRNKDWRMRYWAADMIGYVGNPKTVAVLLKLAQNKKEKKLIRLRALDSIAEIETRYPKELKYLKKELKKINLEKKGR